MSKINFSLCGGKNMCYISEQGSSLYCEQQVISFRPPKQESYKIKGTQPRNSNESFSCKVDIDFPYFSLHFIICLTIKKITTYLSFDKFYCSNLLSSY